MGTSVDLAAGVHGLLRPRTPPCGEDLKDIKPPRYDGNPLNLDRFLEKLDDWGLTVTEDLPPADAERYVFKRFQVPPAGSARRAITSWRPRRGKSRTLKDAKKWLNEQERVDAPQVAAKRWKSIKLELDGREIRLRGTGVTSEGNTPSSAAMWRIGTRVTSRLACSPCCRKHGSRGSPRRESKRAKSNHTVMMMLPKEYHTNVVSWAKKERGHGMSNGTPLRNALLITVSGDREKTAIVAP